jgi:hypothetical protein
MFMPPELLWLEPVIVAAIIVFFVDLIGNMISFNNRILNALTTALVFLCIFGALSYIAYREGNLPPVPAVVQPSP